MFLSGDIKKQQTFLGTFIKKIDLTGDTCKVHYDLAHLLVAHEDGYMARGVGGADRDRTGGLSIRPLSRRRKGYIMPFAFSSSLPPTDLKYFSLEAASDRVLYSSL